MTYAINHSSIRSKLHDQPQAQSPPTGIAPGTAAAVTVAVTVAVAPDPVPEPPAEVLVALAVNDVAVAVLERGDMTRSRTYIRPLFVLQK